MNKAINRVVPVVLAGIMVLAVTSYGFFKPGGTTGASETTETTGTTVSTATIETTPTPIETTTATVTETTSGNLAPREQVLGTVSENQYTNDYFGFALTLPAEWHVADEAEYNLLTKDAVKDIFDAIAGSDTIDLDKIAMLPMLFALKHPIDFKEGPNPSLVINGESLLGQEQMIESSEAYLNIQKARLNQSSIYEYSDITPVTLGGIQFSLMTMTTEVNGITVRQSIYAAVQRGFVLDMVLTYFSEEEKTEMDAILETLQF